MLASNQNESFAIFNYGRDTRYSYEKYITITDYSTTFSLNYYRYYSTSNINVAGKYIFNLTSSTHFAKFGQQAGDIKIQPFTNALCYNVSFLGQSFEYFKQNYQNVNICPNGYIAFDSKSIIAPLKVDTEITTVYSSSSIFYRVSTAKADLEYLSKDINAAFPNSNNTFQATKSLIVTWYKFSYYLFGLGSYTNTYQVNYVSNGNDSYIIINYGQTDVSSNEIKIIDPSSILDYTILRTQSNLTNVNITGKFIFKVDFSCKSTVLNYLDLYYSHIFL